MLFVNLVRIRADLLSSRKVNYGALRLIAATELILNRLSGNPERSFQGRREVQYPLSKQ